MGKKEKRKSIKKKTTINDILQVIQKWAETHEVSFIGSFVEFDGTDKWEIVDDRIIAFGTKEVIQIDLDSFKEMLDAEKDEFINW